jgi:signal transduction histidine kinase
MVFRLIQELLNNILRHAQATHALVQLSLSQDMLTITVEDNGKGFNVQDVEPGGIGLQTVRSRVHAFDGNIDFESEEGSGTTAYIEFHLEKVKTACVS